MSKRPTNGKYHAPASAAVAPVAAKKLSPEQATRAAVAAVFGSLGEIVDAMIRQAADGSHLHAKLLFDFAGISAASLPREAGAEAEKPSLTRLLMDKLDQMAEETAAAEDERPVE